MTETAVPTPHVEWLDRDADVWREHPDDPHKLKIVRRADGAPVPQADYRTRAYVRSQFGELRRAEIAPPPTDDGTCGRCWVAELGLCPRCRRNADAHAPANSRPRASGDVGSN